MNIFVLDLDPFTAASMQSDKHVVKMAVETVQMLSDALILAGKEPPLKVDGSTPMRLCNPNHPCSKWVRRSQDNYVWAVDHLKGLLSEYTNRYQKVRPYQEKGYPEYFLENLPNSWEFAELTPFELAMPDEFKTTDPVVSYREYYKSKGPINVWRHTSPPDWYLSNV